MKTTENRIKKVTLNKSLRHFTIIKEDGTKYRTIQMSKDEFQNSESSTFNDWQNFLNTTDEYFKI